MSVSVERRGGQTTTSLYKLLFWDMKGICRPWRGFGEAALGNFEFCKHFKMTYQLKNGRDVLVSVMAVINLALYYVTPSWVCVAGA
jgi:hypothetical protein